MFGNPQAPVASDAAQAGRVSEVCTQQVTWSYPVGVDTRSEDGEKHRKSAPRPLGASRGREATARAQLGTPSGPQEAGAKASREAEP